MQVLADYLLRLSGDVVKWMRAGFDGLGMPGRPAPRFGGAMRNRRRSNPGMQGLAQRYAEQTKGGHGPADRHQPARRRVGGRDHGTGRDKLAVHKAGGCIVEALAGAWCRGILTGLGADLLTGGLSRRNRGRWWAG